MSFARARSYGASCEKLDEKKINKYTSGFWLKARWRFFLKTSFHLFLSKKTSRIFYFVKIMMTIGVIGIIVVLVTLFIWLLVLPQNTENFFEKEGEGRRIPGSAGAVAGPLPPVVQEEFWLPIDTDPMPYAPARMLAGGYFPVASNIMTKTI